MDRLDKIRDRLSCLLGGLYSPTKKELEEIRKLMKEEKELLGKS